MIHPDEAALPVRAMAELAKLSLAPDEETSMASEMASILRFAQELSALDLSGVSMTAHVVPVENVLREDVPHTPFARETLLMNAPTREDTCITVPPTFSQGGEDA